MRLFIAFMFVFIGGAAYAASPEDSYIAERDKAISAIDRLIRSNASEADVDAADDKARSDLEKRLAAFLGPFSVTGFTAAGRINLETFIRGDMGFGKLDGLRHVQDGKEEGSSILVTTRGLVEHWLKLNAKKTPTLRPSGLLPPKGAFLPWGGPAAKKMNAQSRAEEIAKAFKTDNFYTFSIGSDAAFSTTLDFPLKKPQGADMAVARLGGWAQDIGPNPDQHIVVAIMKGQSIMIADAPVTQAMPEIAKCKALWTAANVEADKFFKIYQDSGLKDDAAFKSSNAAEDKGDHAYRACMGESLPHEPVFPALLGQAQELADHMAGK